MREFCCLHVVMLYVYAYVYVYCVSMPAGLPVRDRTRVARCSFAVDGLLLPLLLQHGGPIALLPLAHVLLEETASADIGRFLLRRLASGISAAAAAAAAAAAVTADDAICGCREGLGRLQAGFGTRASR